MPEFDPSVFEKQNSFELDMLLVDAACALTDAERVIAGHAEQSAEADRLEMQLRNTDVFKSLESAVGAEFASFTIRELSGDEAKSDKKVITPGDVEAAAENKYQAGTAIAEIVAGLAADTIKRSRPFFDTDEETIEVSWSGAWGRLYTIASRLDSNEIVDVAAFFDALVRLKYPQAYDPMDATRGYTITADVAARTFYERFGAHLGRAIVRDTNDGWT